MPKLNICVVGLARDFTDKVCSELASGLELYYANVEKILEFELFDQENMEKICGKEYLLREEKSIIKRLCMYEDTLINLNYFNVNNDEIINTVKEHCLLIYLHMSENRFSNELEISNTNNVFDSALFSDRDKLCSEEADIVIDCEDFSVSEITNITASSIIKYYS